ncbi:MAG: DUF3040 domain-containing protein [Microbacterium gubbeenense]|uniref:DUF3040 domain-containing protein n=1 Tax=Microbacterium gubbeenense TaxID=159896 RepID=UPI0003FEB2E0|nr:DUF3040 domain-containing protein [Microbacterium gubbeenense]
MPLSEQEQRLLDEMERQLMHTDADVVHASTGDRTLSYRNLLLGAVLVLVGLGAIIAGIAMWNSTVVAAVIVGVVGFGAMLAGVILAVSPGKGDTSSDASDSRAPQKTPSVGGASFMDKMNDRWDKRQQG